MVLSGVVASENSNLQACTLGVDRVKIERIVVIAARGHVCSVSRCLLVTRGLEWL